MPTIWIASLDPTLPESLGYHLVAAGQCHGGTPERGAWREVAPPDLVVMAATDVDPGPAQLERLLDFVAEVPHPRRAAPPVLYLEAPRGSPSGSLVRRLIDDRPVQVLSWPLDPDELVARAQELLQGVVLPASLRERARRAWVVERVDFWYAGIDLPALRQAVDPRNAHRPVLLMGERGTRRGLLAQYIHNLAEPERRQLLTLTGGALRPGELEQQLLAEAAGQRVTVYLEGIDRLDPERQLELAHILSAGGALALEPIRWIASATRIQQLLPELRLLAWLRVPLPPLRDRPDRDELIRKVASEWRHRTGRDVELSVEAAAALGRYAWPGNLRELEAAIDATLGGALGRVAGVDELRIGQRTPPVQPAPPRRPEREPEPRRVEPRPSPAAVIEPAPAPAAPVVDEPEPAPARKRESKPESAPTPAAPPAEAHAPDLSDVVPPLAHEIRQPLLAIRTYASLLEQRPDDEGVRRELNALVEDDLGRLEDALQLLERYTRLGDPVRAPFDLAAAVATEIELRQERMRSLGLVLVRELDRDAPPLVADERQLRFAVGALLDRALRMIPRGGELYLGSLYRPPEGESPGGHRLLIRFHSPEEVLLGPEDGPEPLPLEVLLAREVIRRAGGRFAVDASGAQDNIILIELD